MSEQSAIAAPYCHRPMRFCRFWIGVILWHLMSIAAIAARGELELSVIDAVTGEPIAVQMQLINRRGRLIRPAGLGLDGDWLIFDGRTVLSLPPGHYSFRLRRGLEYRERAGNFVIESGAADNHQVDLPRFVEMSKEGWWSGDLQLRPRRTQGLATRILASDLHVVPLTTMDNDGRVPLPPGIQTALEEGVGRHRAVSFSAACDRRQGTTSVVFTQQTPPALPAPSQALPSPFDWVDQLPPRSTSSALPLVHLAHVTSWDLPTWAALDRIDTVGLLHDRIRAGSSAQSPQDRPRDMLLFPDPDGAGRWSQQTYFRLLETGLRIPPAAGSGADESGVPMGAARVYVQCGDELTLNSWWEGLRAGRVVVTNGPMLRPKVNGEWPGHVFPAQAGQSLQLEVQLQLSTQDKIRYLEIIQNGRPAQQVRLEDWVSKKGKLPPVVFERSGWMLVRAVADDPGEFRAATSGPFYVEFDGKPRISRQAAQYFLDWVYERARRVKRTDSHERRTLLQQHRRARDFWEARVEQATVE